jgi:hypothetical protein
MTIKSVYFTSGTAQAIELKLDTRKYDSAVLTAVGGTLVPPAGSNIYPFRSIRQALKSGAIARLRVTVKNGKRLRPITLVCDKDNVDTVRGALLTQSIKVGGTTKVDWSVEKVENF